MILSFISTPCDYSVNHVGYNKRTLNWKFYIIGVHNSNCTVPQQNGELQVFKYTSSSLRTTNQNAIIPILMKEVAYENPAHKT